MGDVDEEVKEDLPEWLVIGDQMGYQALEDFLEDLAQTELKDLRESLENLYVLIVELLVR